VPYTKQPWTDNVTLVDAGHMQHIEDGIFAASSRMVTPAQLTALAPVQDDRVTLQVDAANGIYWELYYDAASASPYKWCYLGGPPLFAEVLTNEGTANDSAWRALTTPLTLTIPRNGDYDITVGAFVNPNGGQNIISNASYAIGATAPNVDDGIQAQYVNAATEKGPTSSRTRRKPGLVAATVIAAQYQGGGSTTSTFADRWLSIVPVRIS
jgi:hypothetical protein